MGLDLEIFGGFEVKGVFAPLLSTKKRGAKYGP